MTGRNSARQIQLVFTGTRFGNVRHMRVVRRPLPPSWAAARDQSRTATSSHAIHVSVPIGVVPALSSTLCHAPLPRSSATLLCHAPLPRPSATTAGGTDPARSRHHGSERSAVGLAPELSVAAGPLLPMHRPSPLLQMRPQLVVRHTDQILCEHGCNLGLGHRVQGRPDRSEHR